MASIFESEEQRFNVVINHEEQYSVWPEGWDIPPGWTATGVAGVKAECLVYIEKAWTDMRPRSLALRVDRGDAR